MLKCCCDLFHEHHHKNNTRKKALQKVKMCQSWAPYADFPSACGEVISTFVCFHCDIIAEYFFHFIQFILCYIGFDHAAWGKKPESKYMKEKSIGI